MTQTSTHASITQIVICSICVISRWRARFITKQRGTVMCDTW